VPGGGAIGQNPRPALFALREGFDHPIIGRGLVPRGLLADESWP
jgi:hypothetical protein